MNKAIADRDFDRLRDIALELETELAHTEEDLSVTTAKLDGDWPNSAVALARGMDNLREKLFQDGEPVDAQNLPKYSREDALDFLGHVVKITTDGLTREKLYDLEQDMIKGKFKTSAEMMSLTLMQRHPVDILFTGDDFSRKIAFLFFIPLERVPGFMGGNGDLQWMLNWRLSKGK